MANASSARPYFFWDYNLSEDQVRGILRSGDSAERVWVIARILEYAKWEDIWRYLTVNDIRETLALIPFRRPQDRELWDYALDRWARHDGQDKAGCAPSQADSM